MRQSMVNKLFSNCTWDFVDIPCAILPLMNNNNNSLYTRHSFWSTIGYACSALCIGAFVHAAYCFPFGMFDARSTSRQEYSFVLDCTALIVCFGCAAITLLVGILTFYYGFFLVEVDKDEISTLGLTPIRETKRIWMTSVSLLSLLGVIFLVKHIL